MSISGDIKDSKDNGPSIEGIIYTVIVATIAVLVSALVYYIVSTLIRKMNKSNQHTGNKDTDNVLFRQGNLEVGKNRPPVSYWGVLS